MTTFNFIIYLSLKLKFSIQIVFHNHSNLTTFRQKVSVSDSWHTKYRASTLHSHINYVHSLKSGDRWKWIMENEFFGLFCITYYYYYYLSSFPVIRLCRVKVIKLFTFKNKKMIYDWPNGQRKDKKQNPNEKYIRNKIMRKYCEWCANAFRILDAQKN